MREIKFRAWFQGKMVPVGSTKWLVEFDGDIWENVGGDWTTDSLVNRGSAVLLQFTGLHDKDGKEIYEGDIVKVQGRKRIGEYLTTIVWRHGSICLARNDTYLIDEKSWVGCEVVGNIYENPELLEEKR